jgi:SAM-dependent methyltransferase
MSADTAGAAVTAAAPTACSRFLLDKLESISLRNLTVQSDIGPSISLALPSALFQLAIFLGAALLFQIQPLVVKRILPWFGATSSVWTTSVMFFQIALVFGYLYAHWLVRRLRHSIAVRLHAALLLCSLALLPVLPSEHWKPQPSDEPVTGIVLLLSCVVGLPYLQLATTSTLLQAMWTRSNPGEQPYHWYAMSNAGSLVGLLSYPLLIEPLWSIPTQAWIWSAAYVLYIILMLVILFGAREANRLAIMPAAREMSRWSWIVISAATSMLMLGATNYLSENIAPMPLVWVIPLAMYLLSFVVSFASLSRFGRGVSYVLGASGLLMLCIAALDPLLMYRLPIALTLVSGAVFFVCLSMHRELYLRRPDAQDLTRFYLSIAIGGAIGAAVIGVIAPLTIPIPIDLVMAMSACAVALISLNWRAGWTLRVLSAAVGAVVLYVSQMHATALLEGNHGFARNFYGTLRIREEQLPGRPFRIRLMTHGLVHHGAQIMDPILRRIPTIYYGYGSGASLAIRTTAHPGQRVGVVGLGAGTLAAYARAGDYYRFYELNPAVVRLAGSNFTYLNDSPGKIEVILGDGRLSLEREQPQNFDVLLLDAFSSDAVPSHLLTREALRVYVRHLAPDGILAFNVTNRALDLESVLAAGAATSGLSGCTFRTGDDPALFRTSATWVLLYRSYHSCPPPSKPLLNEAGVTAWTDDYTSVWPILQAQEE